MMYCAYINCHPMQVYSLQYLKSDTDYNDAYIKYYNIFSLFLIKYHLFLFLN